MIRTYCHAAIIMLSALCFFGKPVWGNPIDDLILMTESLPPLNYEQNGELKGISVDLMDKMLQMVGSKLSRKDIQLMPWARAYRNLQEKDNTVLFLMNRNQTRENLFKWVGPLIPTTYVMIAKKERGIRLDSVNDFRRYRIGVVSKDLGELLMKEMNVDPNNIESVPSGELNLAKLNRHRIDLWNYGAAGAKWIILQNGYKLQDYEIVYVLKNKLSSFFAFHINTSDEIIIKFQNALNRLKTKPSETSLSELEKIVERYKKEGELRVEHSIPNKGTETSINNYWDSRSTFH